MAKNLFLFLCLSFQIGLYAQQTGRMETDRPDQTESPFTVKHKYFQVEVGVVVIKDQGLSAFALPTVLWKYGICRNFELRLITELNIIETPLLVPEGNDFITGLTPVQIGGKLKMFEEKGFLPKTSLLFHIGIPKAASKKFQATKWAPSFIFSMQHTLSENVGLGYNLGFEWDGESNKPYFIYTIAPGFNLGKKWYSFIEFFGAARKGGPPQNNIDSGVGYYINDNVKLDASLGFGINDAAIDHFFGLGVSFRFR